jgi:hypothetical protein
VIVALATELTLYILALVACFTDIVSCAFVAMSTAVVDASDSPLVGLNCPTLDFAHNSLRLSADFLCDGLGGGLARVQFGLYYKAIHCG